MHKQAGKSKENKSRAIANSFVRDKRLQKEVYEFVDNPTKISSHSLETVQKNSPAVQQNIAQRKKDTAEAVQLGSKKRRVKRYDAGAGADWHVHKGHIKYDGNNKSRVNFNQRQAAVILNEVAQKVARYSLPTNSIHYTKCLNYINDNF